ncbi:hypothetical protein ACFWBI_22890 [Streptomyces sp. NPDC059982]|uniref:hypothetical protein n=1 Tax=unclassified Streptomyces TaxID=2593676 RepID=UPI0036A619DE
MPDPTPPSSPSPGSAGPAASVLVGEVIAWYQERIMAERRSPGPDPQRLRQLIALHAACVQDQLRLEDADLEEQERITVLYAARLKELEDSGA